MFNIGSDSSIQPMRQIQHIECIQIFTIFLIPTYIYCQKIPFNISNYLYACINDAQYKETHS